MSVETVSRSSLAAGAWDNLVRNSTDGWTFALNGWQELILEIPEWGLEEHSFAIKDGSMLMAVVPLQFSAASGRISSSGWGGCGPIVSSKFEGKRRQSLLQMAVDHCMSVGRERGATHFELSISPVTQTSIESPWGINPFSLTGMEDHSGLSQVIDLSISEEDLWAGLSPDARRQIRIAKENGYFVERANWIEHLERYYLLHETTYRRTGVTPHPKQYFVGIASKTALTDNSVLWAARSKSGEVVAYHNAAWFNAGASYHTGCSIEEAGEWGVSYLLFWEAMLGAKAAGIRWYDCGSIFPGTTNLKQKGLSTFKTKFGGEPHRFFKAEISLTDTSAVEIPSRGRWQKLVRRLLTSKE
ncbi:MAG TPA: GNAT family N-acetyltransferase [Methylophilaceae bacterium]|nr:GNAT family N-acetyltransferase [Methylophilaceae bacterium]